jgi:DNA-binding transcriptional LysR family regulator
MTETNGIDLNQVATFVRVMEAGSFTAAARTMGLPKSSVSRRITLLEKALSVRLIQRGTRKLVLTEAGSLYFERAREALGRLVEANAAVSDMSRDVAGPIRFTATDKSGFVIKLIAEFLIRYPKVRIEVVMTGRRVDLVNEGFDLALRAKRLADSSLIARRLGRSDVALFASRAYLRKAGEPRRVSDLARHRFVMQGEAQQRHELRLSGPTGEETVQVDVPLMIIHEMDVAVDAVVAGVGIGLIPLAYLGFLEHAGRGATRRSLVRVLPDHQIPGAELSLVSPPTAYEPVRVKLFRDFLTERLRPLMQPDAGSGKRERRPAA